MESKAIVIINETHTLMEDQVRVLNKKFGEGNWKLYLSPKAGWSKNEMDYQIQKIIKMVKEYGKLHVIFASPIPYMLMELTRREIDAPSAEYCESTGLFVHVLHNDRREKKELPNGKYIAVVAKEGWQLL